MGRPAHCVDWGDAHRIVGANVAILAERLRDGIIAGEVDPNEGLAAMAYGLGVSTHGIDAIRNACREAAHCDREMDAALSDYAFWLPNVAQWSGSPEDDPDEVADTIKAHLARLEESRGRDGQGAATATATPPAGSLEDRLVVLCVTRRAEEPWTWTGRRLAEALGVPRGTLADGLRRILARDLDAPGATVSDLRARLTRLTRGEREALSVAGRLAAEHLDAAAARPRPTPRPRQARAGRERDEATRAELERWTDPAEE